MSDIKVDLPEPETPVMATNRPNGICTSIFFKLCSLAPITDKLLPLPTRNDSRCGIDLDPER